MTDNARNVRTLIVSFAIAIMVLIPLRFVEVGQAYADRQTQVLGESVTRIVVVVTPTPVSHVGELEAPFDKIDGPNIGR
jgi:hypothetical protein